MKNLFITLLLFLSIGSAAQGPASPKREFRGAWIQCVNGQWQGMGREKMQQILISQLNELQRCGINAIFFQVRAEADALYESTKEPWSRFLSGQQGVAPSPRWDPLEWMIDACHKRGMELHAWINPYRARTKSTRTLAPTHPYNIHPERFFNYDGQLLFDPGLPENRQYICDIVHDIIQRYDVDGLHIDDYFYPYPAWGEDIPDEATFRRYANGLTDRGDWRRRNVNLLIKQLHDTIRETKPWVKFGVSPFGIYHNATPTSSIPGSDTKGLQNYDDLYADVLCWMNQGWVDYIVPQLYWQIGHPTADYATLIRWWSRTAKGRPIYIGQDIERTVKYPDTRNPATHQMMEKYRLQRSLPGIKGSCQWYAAALCDNVGKYGDLLKSYIHTSPALQPQMPWIDDKAPGKVKKLALVSTSDGPMLFWQAPKAKNEMDQARQYAVYRFDKGEKVNLDDVSHLVALTSDCHYPVLKGEKKKSCIYVVTALDRLQNESKGIKKSVRF